MSDLTEEQFEKKFKKVYKKFVNSYTRVNEKITAEEVDNIIFILYEFDNKIIDYYDAKSNLSLFLGAIKQYVDVYGKKDLLIYLFMRDILLLQFFTDSNKDRTFIKSSVGYETNDPNYIINLDEMLSNVESFNLDGIVYYNPKIKKKVENVLYIKTKKLYSVQDELNEKINELTSKINNFNTNIISIVSIIIAIVPIIAINTNLIVKDQLTLSTIFVVNACLVLTISTIFFMVSSVIIHNSWKKLLYTLLPLGLGVVLLMLA